MKAIEQLFHVVLFIMLKVGKTSKSLDDKCSHSNLRPRLHRSEQISAQTKTSQGTHGNKQIFEPPSVQVWDLKIACPKLAHLTIQKPYSSARPT